MRFSTAASVLAYAAGTHAFADTSPFMLFSSSPLSSPLSDHQTQALQSSAKVLQTTKDFLSTCPSDLYILLQQPALAARDVAPSTSVPYLKRALGASSVRTALSVSEVVGLNAGSAGEILDQITVACGNGKVIDMTLPETVKVEGGIDGKVNIYTLTLPDLPNEKEMRAEALADNDMTAYSTLLEHIPQDGKYTIIFATTPLTQPIIHDLPVYQAQFETTEHLDLKRDLRARAETVQKNNTSLPLFEKYQFFTPGIFMGLVAAFFMLSILYVGLSAISGLEVSYGAFDKEMGPAAQKKLQ